MSKEIKSKEEILKAAYEANVKATPDTNWMSWEDAVADGSMQVCFDAMEAYHSQFTPSEGVEQAAKEYAGNPLQELLQFVKDMTITQTLMNRCDIETVHIPSLRHKIEELLASAALASAPCNCEKYVNLLTKIWNENKVSHVLSTKISEIIWDNLQPSIIKT